MRNPIEPFRHPAASRLLPRAVRPARALARGFTAVAAWARMANGALRLGAADVVPLLDPPSRALAWQALTEMISTIAVLAAADLQPHTGLDALVALADRLRERTSVGLPRPAPQFDGNEPLQFFVLEILIHDLQPCLSRWQWRLASWSAAGRRRGEWPLLAICRGDLVRTRERLIERGWQLGIALQLPGLGRLLPDRPASVPALVAVDELARAETTAITPPDAATVETGWHIYIEAATRLPTPDLPSASGALGEAIAALDTLADETRAALKATPPAPSECAAETIPSLAFRLLIEGLQPFLLEWRPRYRRFLALERSEAKWRRADECRAALMATRARCLPIVEAIGRRIGAPPLPQSVASMAKTGEEPPRQLPPPAQR
ncbi:MAG: hypothetical protein JO081_21185 [Alphaproteobacteria bacterium]|nr:hypothetical protein [Alphaproteobacteria bacterium]